MQLVFSDEQDELRRSVRKFLDSKAPVSATRELMGTTPGYDRAVWAQMAQLGLQGLAIPEEFGGAGYTFVEQAVVLEEIGRVLLSGPMLGSVVLAAGALLDSGDSEVCREVLPGIAVGSTIAALAITEEHGRWGLAEADVATSATEEADGSWRLHGRKSFVLDGQDADVVVVLARTAAGMGLFLVDGEAPGLERIAEPGLDQTRRLASIQLDGVAARAVGAPGNAAGTLARTLDRAALALAAEQIGAARAALDMAVEYSKTRHQFGRPIGSFQAIKHKASEVMMRVESARSAMLYGVWAIASDAVDIPVVAAIAQSTCSEAFSLAAGENIQIHGGIGFTWEHDAHLYFKRATFDRLFLGDPSHHRGQLMDRIGV